MNNLVEMQGSLDFLNQASSNISNINSSNTEKIGTNQNANQNKNAFFEIEKYIEQNSKQTKNTQSFSNSPAGSNNLKPEQSRNTSTQSPTTSSSKSAEKPVQKYNCKYCDKSFTRPSSLTIHTYTHTGERPHECTFPGCNKRFSVLSNLRRHLKLHKKKQFIQLSNDMYYSRILSRISCNMGKGMKNTLSLNGIKHDVKGKAPYILPKHVYSGNETSKYPPFEYVGCDQTMGQSPFGINVGNNPNFSMNQLDSYSIENNSALFDNLLKDSLNENPVHVTFPMNQTISDGYTYNKLKYSKMDVGRALSSDYLKSYDYEANEMSNMGNFDLGKMIQNIKSNNFENAQTNSDSVSGINHPNNYAYLQFLQKNSQKLCSDNQKLQLQSLLSQNQGVSNERMLSLSPNVNYIDMFYKNQLNAGSKIQMNSNQINIEDYLSNISNANQNTSPSSSKTTLYNPMYNETENYDNSILNQPKQSQESLEGILNSQQKENPSLGVND
ncbi:hypothetical protein BB560_002881, partial [Smittium megazygosporum]